MLLSVIKCDLQVTSRNVVLSDERLLGIDNLINTTVSVEGGFNGVKCYDGTVSSSTAEFTLSREGRREADGVVEGESERLVNLLTTLATVEKVLLDIIEDREQDTTGCVSGGTAVSASSRLDEGS